MRFPDSVTADMLVVMCAFETLLKTLYCFEPRTLLVES